uniref:Caudal type homeobox 1 b n=1 Tax=Paramormyrops kingsleyae TaxID=1676925 RepID=A0A3B3SEA9_9TELE
TWDTPITVYTGMYSNSVRHSSLNLNHQNYVPAPPQYTDFTGYHHVPGISNDSHHSQATGTWNPTYAPPREEWSHYGAGTGPSTSNPGQISFNTPEFTAVQPQSQGLFPPAINAPVGQLSPNSQRRNPYEWMRRSATPCNPGNAPGQDLHNNTIITDLCKTIIIILLVRVQRRRQYKRKLIRNSVRGFALSLKPKITLPIYLSCRSSVLLSIVISGRSCLVNCPPTCYLLLLSCSKAGITWCSQNFEVLRRFVSSIFFQAGSF